MQNFEFIKPLSDGPEFEKAMAGKAIAKDDLDFSEKWLNERNVLVVPVESTEHFTRNAIDRMAWSLEGRICFAVVIEQISNFPQAFALNANTDALAELDRVLSPFAFLLFDPALNWAILCSKANYYLIAGDPNLVSSILAEPIVDVQAKFWEFSQHWSDRSLESHLREISNRYLPSSVTTMALSRRGADKEIS